jgi:hypothetical protein
MNTLSKIMATTAVATLFAGAAIAQAPVEGAEVDEQVVAPEADEGVAGTAPAPSPDISVAPAEPAAPVATEAPAATTEAPAAPQEGVSPGAVTEVAPGETDPVTVALSAIEHGEPASVVSTDGHVLGSVNQATADDRGAAQLSIALDPSLDAGTPNADFVGMAQVDADGNIVLPFTQAEFVSRVQTALGG